MIVTDYLNDNSLSLEVDGFIINTFFSVFPDKKFNDEEIIKIIKDINLLNNSKKIILNIDKIIDEKELSKLKRFLNKFINKVDYLIYSDYAVYTLLTEINQDKKNKAINNLDKLIYDSKTLVCSYHEANTIQTKTFISTEISQEELEEILINSNSICLNCFGLHQIMYSKRPLLSLYNDFNNDSLLKNNVLYDLKEEIRDEYYKIIENNNGTFIYTPYFFALTKLSKELVDKVFMFRVNSAFILNDDLKFVLECYNKFINGEVNDITDVIKDYFKDNVSNGFLKEKLFLLKSDKKGDKDE